MAFTYFGIHREATAGAVTIFEYERGLLYREGRFQSVLGPGRYRIWPFSRKRIVVVDTRRASLQIINQKVLTADQVAVTLNLIAEYEISDVAKAVHTVADFRGRLYEDVQMAVRGFISATPLDNFLQERTRHDEQFLEAAAATAETYGVRLLRVGVKDVILAPRLRDLLMKEVEARRLAQAMLIGAREEVATLRALANAARLAEEHPHLLSLRELDTLRAFAQTPGNTVVVGTGATVLPRGNRRAPRPPKAPAPSEPERSE